MEKKKYRNDIILIISLLLVSLLCFLSIYLLNNHKGKYAHIYVGNDIVENIDLSKKLDEDYYIDGLKGRLHIHTRDGYIAVVESNCPHQDCVKTGYINDPTRPIICAYNAVSIVIDGSSINDVEIIL